MFPPLADPARLRGSLAGRILTRGRSRSSGGPTRGTIPWRTAWLYPNRPLGQSSLASVTAIVAWRSTRPRARPGPERRLPNEDCDRQWAAQVSVIVHDKTSSPHQHANEPEQEPSTDNLGEGPRTVSRYLKTFGHVRPEANLSTFQRVATTQRTNLEWRRPASWNVSTVRVRGVSRCRLHVGRHRPRTCQDRRDGRLVNLTD